MRKAAAGHQGLVLVGKAKPRSGVVIVRGNTAVYGTRHTDADADRDTWYDLTGLGSRDATLTGCTYQADRPNSNSDTNERGYWDSGIYGYFPLANFGWTTSSGWAGSGTASDPYRLQFDGVDDRGSITSAYAVAHLRNSTMQAVVYWSTPSSTRTIYSECATGNDNQYFALQARSDGKPQATYSWGAGQSASVVGTSTLTDGQVYDITATLSGTTMTLYVGGVSQGTATIGTTSWTAGRITMGCRYGATAQEYWGGGLIALRTFGNALSSGEVGTLASLSYTDDVPQSSGLWSRYMALEYLAARAVRYSGWTTDSQGRPVWRQRGYPARVLLPLSVVRTSLEARSTTWEAWCALPRQPYAPVSAIMLLGACGTTPSGHSYSPLWGPLTGYGTQTLRWYHRDAHNSSPPWTLTSAPVCDGAIHHLVGTLDGSAFRLYCDGVLVGQNTVNIPNPAEDWAFDDTATLGSVSLTWPSGVDVYAFRVYSRPLSADEVAHNYAIGPFGGTFPHNGLVLSLNSAVAAGLSSVNVASGYGWNTLRYSQSGRLLVTTRSVVV